VKVVSGTLAPGVELIDSRTGRRSASRHSLKDDGQETADIDGALRRYRGADQARRCAEPTTRLSAQRCIALSHYRFGTRSTPVAIVAKTKADEDKLGTALKSIVEEDPSLIMRPRRGDAPDRASRRWGDTAVDVVLSRLRDRFHAESELAEPAYPLPRDHSQDG